MRNLVITVESGSDMPADLARRYGIHVVPMHITFGAVTRDDGTFPVSDICAYYAQTGAIPKTSGCTPGDFDAVFGQIRRSCPGVPILHLAYSAVTTCSYQSATLAAKELGNITCVDTRGRPPSPSGWRKNWSAIRIGRRKRRPTVRKRSPAGC